MESFMELSEKLTEEAGRKWEALQHAALRQRVTFSEDAFHGSLRPVLAFSDFISQNCTRYPLMLQDLVQGGDLFRLYSKEEYGPKLQQCLPDEPNETSIGTCLRHFRRREMVRIAWRDLAGWADLQETMDCLSSLADSCLNQVETILYDRLCREYGIPVNAEGTVQRLVVLAMGKLGAGELNYSSDIDLIFAYPDSGNTVNGPAQISNEAFFIHLCRRLIAVLSKPTSEGFVFRVDTNLRPFGENGPLVMSFDNMEDYYLRQGREWERYAWIKARVAAGDIEAGSRLLLSLKPFVFRRYLDFGVFDALREMKMKISREVSRKSMAGNIKLGSGGIREIEFFGQIFQLTRGGINPELQDRSILKVLALLAGKQMISQKVHDHLFQAYIFLRRTEHRLQEFADQQTHQIPADSEGCERLSAAMGFLDTQSFFNELSRQMGRVHKHFNTLLENPQPNAVAASDPSMESLLSAVWLAPADREQDKKSLENMGFLHSDTVLDLLDGLRTDSATRALSSEGRQRLDRLIPFLLKETLPLDQQDLALNRTLDILKAIERRTSYLALLLENPHARLHLVKLAHASPMIATLLSRHPALLDELLDTRTLYTPPEKAELEAEIAEKMRLIPSQDLEYQIEHLCIFKQVNMLRVAAADVTGALPLMRTSDHLTEIAETVLNQVLELSWKHLVAKHGTPFSSLEGIVCNKGFAVIAYGKLGGIELGYGSDLDLVFLHAGDPGETDGGTPLDNFQFFARLGQRVIHMLTARTPAGKLYEVDMRLRPSGSSGVLVSHIDAFEQYQTGKAWTWEHQALVRSRPIGGDTRVCERFQAIRRKVIAQSREPEVLRSEVGEMRERLRREHANKDPQRFDIKQDIGGIIDIEFLVQYLVLSNSHEHLALLQWTDNVRLLQTLIETGILADYQAHFLKEAYLTYRAAVHRLNLQERPAVVSEDRFRSLRENVAMIWKHYMLTS
ncbi:MAG: bifunctional [glutamate--ammonia ligase]-adenylyl-L-tyrosine phosphorylase/[glutamate--ammonia-ligase] adenylyltransferase [Deltaproteobacteria bacterium]|nr:bifunctional [glutamate--ammonia ligase]-adenylyl-L-tyrosine phosphorylase/[glutamate--ammonia-ligase] adenylyltransferase [Deltaproteobacteria bacterium]